jgi:hypothetical protein
MMYIIFGGNHEPYAGGHTREHADATYGTGKEAGYFARGVDTEDAFHGVASDRGSASGTLSSRLDG